MLLKRQTQLRPYCFTTHGIVSTLFFPILFLDGILHSQSHGICIATMGDTIRTIKITLMKNGMFQRLMDAWSCLGASVAFSEYFPIFEGEDIVVEPNKMPLQTTRCFDLFELLAFDPYDTNANWKDIGRTNLVLNSSLRNSMGTPQR
jgi:hypothetical protein